ncbi:MAG: hypothetical protein OHK0046_09270 [Anaerolineae bacterium]
MKFMKFSFLAVLLLLIGFAPIRAQDPITVTVTAPSWMGYFFDTPDIIDGFAEANPGYEMVFVDSLDDTFGGAYQLMEDPEGFFENMAAYASTADVLFFDPYMFSPEMITAGYLLDLRPLVQTDPTFDESDYYLSALDAYAYDGGLWALPATASPRFLVYNEIAFNSVGLSAPSPDWTLSDFEAAARALTVDSDPDNPMPALVSYGSDAYFIRGFYGQPFYDAASGSPQLDTPELAAMLDTWRAMEENNLINSPNYTGFYEAIPMRTDGPWALNPENYSYLPPEAPEISVRPALLPGNVAIVDAVGLAISAGTQDPEAAYRLVRYLSDRYGEQYGSSEPARRSLMETQQFGYVQFLSPEDRAFVEEVLDTALPRAEMRYSTYVERALQMMRDEDLDGMTALMQMQEDALTAYEMALERANTEVIQVAPPPAPPVLAEGEIALNFGLNNYGPSIPNREDWERVIEQFVADDPQVGHVSLDARYNASDPSQEIDVDCYLESYNRIQDRYDTTFLSTLLSLDPFMDADPNFDPNDFIGTTLEQVQYEGRTYGYPLTMEALILSYDPNIFNAAGVQPPANGIWTIEEFTRALDDLQFVMAEDVPPFQMGGGGLENLMLVAAFGGMPYDFTTQPPTINFTDPANVEALRQMLDLARDGLITYYPSTREAPGMMFGGGGPSGEPNEDGLYTNPALYITYSNPFMFQYMNDESNPLQGQFPFTTYPRGSRYTPVSYNIGLAYITTSTLYPEACYRWISTIAEHPELLLTMPTRYSALENPALEATLGEDVMNLYRGMAEVISDPNSVSFSYAQWSSTPGDFVAQRWFNSVMDDYVVEEEPIDLEARLADAELKITEFLDCTAALAPFEPNFGPDANQEEIDAYYEDYFDEIDACGVAVDPEYESPFSRSEA